MNAKIKRGGCPICGRAAEAPFRPFCSKRCADVDLGRWLGERYIVSEPAEPEEKPGHPAQDHDEGED
jgi:endogenous inhibitor of DNA gyrase (YacG/DUF329 family)